MKKLNRRMNRYSVKDQMERFGITKEEAEEKINKFLEKRKNKWNIYSVEEQIKRYSLTKEEAIEKINKMKSVNVFSIEWQIKKFNITKEEAIEKIKTIKNKLRESQENMSDFDFNSMIPSKKEHWIKKGFSEEESIKKSNDNIKIATDNCNIVSKDKIKNPEKYIGTFDTSIEYYLKQGYSEAESKKLLSERQSTFTLEKCIKKYGDLKGQKKWKKRQEKWSSSLLNNGNLKIGYSKVSQDLFDKICDSLDENIFYGRKNNEISLTNGKRGFLYDFVDLKNKKIIKWRCVSWKSTHV